MQLQQIRLTTFKNHQELKLNFSSNIVAFCGSNGTGKTNLLDAIYLLCMCKSYFQSVEANVVTHGEKSYTVFGKLLKEETHEVACTYLMNDGKKFKYDKKVYDRLADHIGKMPVVFIAPGDIALIQEGSEERRRFMDSLLSQTDARYLSDLIRYHKALEQRNRLLKMFKERGAYDVILLESINEQLCATAEYIYEQRKKFIVQFRPAFAAHHARLTDQNEEVSLYYNSDLDEAPLDEIVSTQLKQDLEMARTSKGLHRDDLELKIENRSLKKFGSQGQIKTYLIALKLAQFDYLKDKTGVKPFLLLDDIFEKLDGLRAARLMELVANDHFGQIFLSDTHRERVETIFSEMGQKAEIFELKK